MSRGRRRALAVIAVMVITGGYVWLVFWLTANPAS